MGRPRVSRTTTPGGASRLVVRRRPEGREGIYSGFATDCRTRGPQNTPAPGSARGRGHAAGGARAARPRGANPHYYAGRARELQEPTSRLGGRPAEARLRPELDPRRACP